jgi:outer membrane biosynthesis protein TonB
LALLLLLLLLLGWLGWMYWPWQKVPPENLNVVENGTVDHPKSPEAALKSPDEKLKTEGKKTETAEAVTPDKPITPVEPTATPDTTPTTPNNPETIVVHPAVPEIIVPPEVEPPRGDRPSAVKILSDQGATVKIPAGAEFDDFRVVAEYSDGFTRLVTKKATIQPTDVSENAPVAVRNGRLVGVRPGKTLVQAEFDGVAAK